VYAKGVLISASTQHMAQDGVLTKLTIYATSPDHWLFKQQSWSNGQNHDRGHSETIDKTRFGEHTGPGPQQKGEVSLAA
jgi:hypothetical protein